MYDSKNTILNFIPSLRRYARALTGELSMADQVVKQSFDCAVSLNHLFKDELEADKKVRLFSIFHQMYNDYINEQKKVYWPLDHEALTTDLGAVDKLDSKYRNDKFYQIFYQLPLLQKQVFLLVTLERFKYEEVTRILNLPLGAMLSQLHTARRFIADKVYSRSAAQSTSVGANETEEAAEMSL